MTVRQDEPVTVEPARVGCVVPHDPREQDVGEGRERHRRAGVTGVGALRAVHGKATDDVYAALFDTWVTGNLGHRGSLWPR